jgi:transposase
MTDMAADPGPPVLAQRVDIALSDGRRILVEGPASLASVVGLVQGLTA